MALYGDRPRAARAFAAALAELDGSDNMQWLARDYGTLLRDQAAVLTLAAETRTEPVDLRSLATKIAASEAAKKLHQHAGERLDAARRRGADQGLRQRTTSRSTAARFPGRSSGASPASGSPRRRW